MKEETARLVCKEKGSQLFSYIEGKSAYLAFPSHNQVIISIGEETAVLFSRSFFRGWKSPKVQSTYPIYSWIPDWTSMTESQRSTIAILLLDGLLEAFSGCRSLFEAKHLMGSWLKNPLEIAQSMYARVAVNETEV